MPGSEILLKNVGINPTRDGLLRVCKDMGADITLLNVNMDGEPTADLLVRASSLHGTTVGGEIIPTLIDEIPMIAVMAAFAEGTTVIKDAKELKRKRIRPYSGYGRESFPHGCGHYTYRGRNDHTWRQAACTAQ